MEPGDGETSGGRSLGPTPRLAWLGVAGLVLVLLLAPVRAEAPSWGDPTSGLAWSNGAVLCQFFPTRPFVNVSSTQLPGTGMVVGLESLYEESGGRPVALASVVGANWTVANVSSEGRFAIQYSAQLTEASTGGISARLGTVSVDLQYVLPAYDTSGGSFHAVTATMTVSGWTWQSHSDGLVLVLPLAPADPSSEELVAGPADSVTGQSIAQATAHQEFTPGGTVEGTPSSGSAITQPVNLSSTVTPASATVSVVIGPGAAGFASIAYSAQVSIVPGTIAGIPLYQFVVVAGAAAAVVALVAYGTRRARRRPSSLEFIEEEP